MQVRVPDPGGNVNEQSEEPESGKNASESGVKIAANIAPSFAYASFQNSVSVVRSISIENGTGESLQSCTLELQTTPPFLRPKTWRIDGILAGGRHVIADRKVSPDPSYLDSLDETESGELT